MRADGICECPRRYLIVSYVQQDILWHPPIPVVDGMVPDGFMEARKLAIKRYRDEENEIPKARRRTSRGGSSHN